MSTFSKQLTTIYLALISGQILIAAIFVFIGNTENPTITTSGSVFNYLAPIISLGTIMLAFLLRDKFKQDAKSINDEKERAEHHRRSNLISWGLLGGGNLCMLVFFFLEGNYLYLLLFSVGMAAFIFLRPEESVLN